jgi:hypothetical protein
MVRNTLLLVAIVQLTALGLPSVAQARIGETRSECEQRYGTGSDLELEVGAAFEKAAANWTASVYSTHGLTIEVVFENDRAVFVRYMNQPVFSLGNYDRTVPGLTQKEIEYLKRANAGSGAEWRRFKEPVIDDYAPTVTVWKTADGKYFCGYDREGKRFFVCDSGFWEKFIVPIRESATASDRSGSAARLEGL